MHAAADWFDDDGFWELMADVMFTPARVARSAAEVDSVLLLAGELPRATALDMPCGPGRHALCLAARGLAVTGVDRTARYLEQAREAAREAGVVVRWVQSDMRTVALEPGAYGLATNLYSSFGYFEDPDDDRRVLEQLFNALAPGGALVVDLLGLEVLARVLQPQRVHWLGETLLVERVEVEPGWMATHTEWTLVPPDGPRVVRRFRVRTYSAGVLRGLLLRVGFRSVQVFGALDGRAYDLDAERLVVVARR